jgi:hypothetical protein
MNRPTTGMSRHDDRPMTGMSRRDERPMTGMSIRQDDRSMTDPRPMTGMSIRHEEPLRPMTGNARHEEPPPRTPREEPFRPGTGIPRNEEFTRPLNMSTPTRPLTGSAQRQEVLRSQGRTSSVDESPPSSQRSRSRGASQSPFKGIINEHPIEGMTHFCRQDSGSARHNRANVSRNTSSSSTSSSESPSKATSSESSGSFQLNTPVRSVVTPNVLHRKEKSPNTTPSPTKKSHSFWNFGSKSPKQGTPKLTPTTSPIKTSKSVPTGMAVPILQRPSPRSQRGISEEPIAPGAAVQLNIGQNVLEVNNPDHRQKETSVSIEDDDNDPLVAALKDLQMASRGSKSPTKREELYRSDVRHEESSYSPTSLRQEPRRQEPAPRPSTSQNIRQSGTPPGRAAAAPPSPVTYDSRRNTLGAPPPAHSAAEMERTRRQYQTQVQQVLNGRPHSQIIHPRSLSPRPRSRQSTYEDDSYNARPSSAMSMHGEEPPRSRSPAPQRVMDPPRSRSPAPPPMQRNEPPRSRSPAPPPMQRHEPPRSRSPNPYQDMRSRSPIPQEPFVRSRSPAPQRPTSRQEMEHPPRTSSRQDFDRRRSVSPAPFQRYPPEERRSPSPQPYVQRSVSPNPAAMARPRSSAANPYGIQIDRFGNVVDQRGEGERYPVRGRSKSQADLRGRTKYTDDGKAILFIGTCE